MLKLHLSTGSVVTILCFSFIFSSFRATAAELPADIKWMTNDTSPTFANQSAPKGGTYKTWVQTFPLTLRTEGPDSNGSFAGFTRDLTMKLLEIHPNTREFLPSLATHWAIGKDHQSVYFKLDKDARWSDGEKVTADDYTYLIEFMRSEHIKAPWYNNFYTSELKAIDKIDDYTIVVTYGNKKSDEELLLVSIEDLRAQPEHFLRDKVNADWVKKHNWTILPNTGPYSLSKVKKGKSITLKRNKDWWAKDKKYYIGRYNVDKIRIKVIRDQEIAFQAFQKGELDSYTVVLPDYWHAKAKGELFDKGYIQKLWFFTDRPQGSAGVWLNQGVEFLKNKDMRKGITHALNIDKMIATALRGDYQRLESLGSGFGDYTNTQVKPLPFDADKAMGYFAKVGYKDMGPNGYLVDANGKELTLQLTYHWPVHAERVAVLREEAKKAGLNLKLNLIEGANGFKTYLEKQHQAGFIGMGSGYVPAYWEYYHSDNAYKPQTNNFTNTSMPELDKLVDAYRGEFIKAEKAKYSLRIQEIVMEEAAYIPTYKVPYVRSAYWRWMKLPEIPGTALTRTLFAESRLDLGLFWIDKEAKEETKSAMKKGKTFEPVTKTDATYKL